MNEQHRRSLLAEERVKLLAHMVELEAKLAALTAVAVIADEVERSEAAAFTGRQWLALQDALAAARAAGALPAAEGGTHG